MDDQAWKLHIRDEISTIKADVKHIMAQLKHFPICEKRSIKEKIKVNRWLIYVILGIIIPASIKSFM